MSENNFSIQASLDRTHADFLALRGELQDVRKENLQSVKAATEARLEIEKAKLEINQNINRLYEKKLYLCKFL